MRAQRPSLRLRGGRAGAAFSAQFNAESSRTLRSDTCPEPSDTPLSATTVQKAMKLGVARADIRKPATPHTMRHSFATSMLEAGVDLLTISKLLGHASFVTTMIYLHVRRQHFDRSPSPIDWLPVRQCPKWADPTDPQANNNNNNRE